MLYGTPPRAAHRASVDGALALLLKGAGHHRPTVPSTGTHIRPRLQRRAPREPERAAQWLTRGLAMLIVLGVTGMIGFLIVADSRRGVPAEASTAPRPGGPLDARATDAEPLSLQEVFPEAEVVRTPALYRIGMTHIDTECRIATTGELGRLLQDHGCSQVVRAWLTAPYGDYQVTTGLFNLTDAAGATEVDERLRELVETGDGSFAAMSPGELGADPSAAPTAQVGWHARGHYLLYCVITRPDGHLVANDDPNAARINAELVDSYLGETVLGKRDSST